MLVTIREQPATRFHEKLRRTATAVHARNVAAMIFHIIDVRGDEFLQDALQLRDDVNRLSRRVEDEGDAVDGGDIQSLKRRAHTFAVMFEDQHATVAVFRQLRSDVLQLGELMEYYRELEGALNQLVRKMERLDGQLQDTRQLHHAALQEKTNRRLFTIGSIYASISFGAFAACGSDRKEIKGLPRALFDRKCLSRGGDSRLHSSCRGNGQ